MMLQSSLTRALLEALLLTVAGWAAAPINKPIELRPVESGRAP
jgi:hypothetical protein